LSSGQVPDFHYHILLVIGTGPDFHDHIFYCHRDTVPIFTIIFFIVIGTGPDIDYYIFFVIGTGAPMGGVLQGGKLDYILMCNYDSSIWHFSLFS